MADGPCAVDSWKYDQFMSHSGDNYNNHNNTNNNNNNDDNDATFVNVFNHQQHNLRINKINTTYNNKNDCNNITTTTNNNDIRRSNNNNYDSRSSNHITLSKYDQTQWWSRRDALCRIINASIWKNKYIPYCFIIDSCLFFENQSINININDDMKHYYFRPILIHHANQIYNNIIRNNNNNNNALNHVNNNNNCRNILPIENILIKQWKEVFIKNQYNVYSNISSILKDNNDDNDNKHDIISGNNEPWKEMELINNYILSNDNKNYNNTRRTTSNARMNIDNNSSRSGNSSNISEDHSLDKREMLAILQSKCSIEFLREHSLNGSMKLILKKMNFEKIHHIYTLYSNNNKMNIKINLKEYSLIVNKHIDNEINNDNYNYAYNNGTKITSDNYRKLVNSFKVLLLGMIVRARQCYRSKRRSIRRRRNDNDDGDDGGDDSNDKTNVVFKTTLLLLHEDYPYELPVFGMDNDDNDNDDGHYSKNSSYPNFIICFMGAVRDATSDEEKAVIEAATLLHIDYIGANLGRTAEFTSKIVTSLIGHTIANKLHQAVANLTLRYQNNNNTVYNNNNDNSYNNNNNNTNNYDKHNSYKNNSNNNEYSNNSNNNNNIGSCRPSTITTTSSCIPSSSSSFSIQKLVPSRHGGLTWDGHRNLHILPINNCKKRKNDVSNNDNTNDDNDAFHQKKNKKNTNRGGIDNDVDLCSSTLMNISSNNDKTSMNIIRNNNSNNKYSLYIISWLSIIPDEIDITMNLEIRERMHGIIQLIISTLWRSRLVSEKTNSTTV